jgi:hypothetical protein
MFAASDDDAIALGLKVPGKGPTNTGIATGDQDRAICQSHLFLPF